MQYLYNWYLQTAMSLHSWPWVSTSSESAREQLSVYLHTFATLKTQDFPEYFDIIFSKNFLRVF